MKYIIAGMRDFTDWNYFKAHMALLKPYIDIDEVVSGGDKGVDYMGEYWAKEKGLKSKVFPADWDRLGKRAGHERNKKMADYADGLIAFWNGYSKGTKDMIKLANYYQLEGYVIRTDIPWNKRYDKEGRPELNNLQPLYISEIADT